MPFNFDTKPDNFTREDEVMVDAVEKDGRPTITFSRDNENPKSPSGPEQPHKRRSRSRTILWWTLCLMAVVLVAAFWIRYFSPYTVDAQERGYIINLECRGFVFKTWEGEMIVGSAIADSTKTYMRDFDFSVEKEKVAKELMRYKNAGREVIVTYKHYLGTIPWRGEHKNIIDKVEPVELPDTTHLHRPVLNATTPPAEEEVLTPAPTQPSSRPEVEQVPVAGI